MFGSAILDTAIGLIFVFLVVSLTVSAANELLAALFKWRAKNPLLGIRQLLQDPSVTGLVTQFYEHPFIEGLSAKDKKPSYIPANADSGRIAKSLSGVNSTLRDSIKDAAHSFIEKNLQQENTQTQLHAATEAIGNLALPIGWVNGGFGPTTVLGWFITALAATLGAPFWFDLLNRFVNIRASGKAPEEEPKSPKEVPSPKQPGG